MSTIKTHILLLAVLVLLVAASAQAAIQTVETNLTIPIDYHDFNRNSQNTIDKNAQFTLRNTGTDNVTVQVAVTGLPSGYVVSSIANTLVTAGGTSLISFTINVPHKQNSGTASIGTIIISDTAGVELARLPLVQETKSMLDLKKVTVSYTDKDDDSQKDSFDRTDTSFSLDKKALVGTEVTVKFDIANLFNSNYDDGNLENIELNFEADDSDLYQKDIDNSYSFEDLDSSDDGTLEVSFTISEEAPTKDYDIDITIEAEDGKNTAYKIERTLTISIERKKDDVRITKAVVSPTEITACDSSFMLDTTVRNLGKSRQKNILFSIFNQKLGIDTKQGSIELDPFDNGDDTFSKKFVFPLKNPTVGKQTLTLKVANDKQLDSEPVEVTITACAKAPVVEEEETTEEPAQNNPPVNRTTTGSLNTGAAAAGNNNPETPAAGTETITSSAIVETVENPWTKEDMLIGLFVLAIIMTLALIIIFFIILLK